MGTAIPTPAMPCETPRVASYPAGPLDSIQMSAHERRQAEHDMRTAERIVSFAFDAFGRIRALARRLRGNRLVSVTH